MIIRINIDKNWPFSFAACVGELVGEVPLYLLYNADADRHDRGGYHILCDMYTASTAWFTQ